MGGGRGNCLTYSRFDCLKALLTGADFDDLIKATRERAGEAAKAGTCPPNDLDEAEEAHDPDSGAHSPLLPSKPCMTFHWTS